MKELFLDGIKVDLQEELTQTVDTQFLDSYQPEALIGAHSKTVTLPGTAKNNTIFANQKERYEAIVWENGSRVLYGYATLDKVKKVNQETYYDVTLYTMLGEFFSNLKGTDREPKDLADLYYGFSGFNPSSETRDAVVLTLDEFFAHNSWIGSGSATEPTTVESTFTVVPGNFDLKNFNNEKLLFNETRAGIKFFKTGSDDGSGSYFTSGSNNFVLVGMEENTPYAMMNIPIYNMPMGVRYRKVIEACCKPVNNGGYTVNLDPDWFNNNNPYWTEMFIMFRQLAQDFDFSQIDAEGNSFTYPSAVVDSGSSGTYQISASADMVPWTAINGNLSSTSIINKVEGTFKYKPKFRIGGVGNVQVGFITEDAYGINGTVNANWTPGVQQTVTYNPPDGFNSVSKTFTFGYPNLVQIPAGGATVTVTCMDVNTSTVIGSPSVHTLPALTLQRSGSTAYYTTDQEYTIPFTVPGSMINSGVNTIQFNVTLNVNSTIRANLTGNNVQLGQAYDGENHVTWNVYINLYANQTYAKVNRIQFVAPPTGAHWMNQTTTYTNTTLSTLATVQYSKADMIAQLGTPLDWFIKYLRMFNLRVYCHPDSKIIDVMTLENYINKFTPKDLTDKLDYSQEYTSENKVIDESYIKWEVTPGKNESVDRYVASSNEDLFDKVVKVRKYGTDEYDYLNTEVKVASEAQKATPFLARYKIQGSLYSPRYHKWLFGINQRDVVQATYHDVDTDQFYSSDYHVEYVPTNNKYQCLECMDDVNGMLVMRDGYRAIRAEECGSGTCTFGCLPVLVYRPSAGMVLAAGKPCFLGGWEDNGARSQTWFTFTNLYGCTVMVEFQYPTFNYIGQGKALSYKPENFEEFVNTSDIYTDCFEDFITKTYLDPETVKCSVFLDYPETRRLYFFENKYWILSKVEGWVGPDQPCKCTFVKYAATNINVEPEPVPEPITDNNIIGTAIIGPTFIIG